MRALMVLARSAALMPVVVLARASTDTVKAVSMGVGVVLHHAVQLELIGPIAGDRRADQSPTVRSHQVDRRWGDQFGRHNENRPRFHDPHRPLQ